jgi:hypothetical protein
MRTLPTVLQAALLLVTPSLASATSIQTMTFTGLPPNSPDQVHIWMEDGITATSVDGAPIASFGLPDAPHLDGRGTTPFTFAIDFTTGSLFDAISVDILPGGSAYCSSPSFPSSCTGPDEPMDYIWVTGFHEDEVVTELGFYRPPDDQFETIALGSFPTIDRLRVQVRTFFELGLPGTCDVGRGCGHFTLDNVSLRAASPAIPEPTAALLFAAGLLCAAFRRPSARPA